MVEKIIGSQIDRVIKATPVADKGVYEFELDSGKQGVGWIHPVNTEAGTAMLVTWKQSRREAVMVPHLVRCQVLPEM